MSPEADAGRSRAERIFRAAGVAPLGVFVLLHVLGYAELLFGDRPPRTSNAFGGWVALALEIVLVLIPLIFHAGYGLLLVMRTGRSRAARDHDPLHLLQRWTSPVVLLFLVDHYARFRWPMVSGLTEPADANALLMRELSATVGGVPATAAFHCLGIAAVAFHLGYGLYSFDWAKVPYLAARGRRVWLGTVVGLAVLVLGSFSIIELATGKTFPFV